MCIDTYVEWQRCYRKIMSPLLIWHNYAPYEIVPLTFYFISENNVKLGSKRQGFMAYCGILWDFFESGR